MKTSITAGLSKERQEEVRGAFTASSAFRERLTEILDKKINTTKTSKTSLESYESPSWAYLQADANGYERAIREVISLLSS